MMKFGTKFDQRDIVIVPFPFSDLSSVKQRPVLILSKSEYNRKTNDIIVCGITSNLKDADYSILIDDSNLSEGFVPVKSRIKADKVFTLDQSLVRKKIARVNEETFSKVREEIANLI